MTPPRVVVVERGPGPDATLRSAVAGSDVAVLLPSGAQLDDEQLDRLVGAVAAPDGADVAYGDLRLRTGDQEATVVAPAWSPLRLLGEDYLRGPVACRTELLESATDEADPAAWLAVWLRLAESGARFAHVDATAEAAGDSADAAADVDTVGSQAGLDERIRIVSEQLARSGRDAVVTAATDPRFLRVRLRPPAGARASLIVPTRGGRGEAFGKQRTFVTEFVRDVAARQYRTDYEWVIVADTDGPRGYLDELQAIAGRRLRVVDYDQPFNFAEKCNLGALAATGDYVVFLNDDMGVITDDWLDALVGLAADSDVGAVGCKLRFDDGSLQHAGHVYDRNHAYHAYRAMGDDDGIGSELVVDREVSGVTGATVAQRREAWEAVGGFSEKFPNNYNDVDYCLKLRLLGLRVIQANSVELYHFETKTRVNTVRSNEGELMRRRWRHELERERYTVFRG